jgi:16S rRNA (cytidine1402-2'-O)-methyltransferase
MERKGKLYMIPIPISEGALDTVLPTTISLIHSLRFFVAENARTARRFISSTSPPFALQEVSLMQLDKHHPVKPGDLLFPLLEGKDIGVMSEAGCPGVADPGTQLVAWAHNNSVKVVPLIGPSSILLALMASGLNGQCFTFHGYLSPKRDLLKQDLKRLEAESQKNHCTQIFIEAPYRNGQVLETVMATLRDKTLFSIASNLTANDEYIRTNSIEQWRKDGAPDMHRKASIFLLYAR